MRYLLVFLLVGCQAVDYTWTKTGATNEDQDRDFEECAEPHKATAFVFGMAGGLASNPQIRECMVKKGWQPPK